MTAQNSANKSVFYKFLPYYLNKVKYLRPQLIMSIIFSVLSYPAFISSSIFYARWSEISLSSASISATRLRSSTK